eukprot:1158790-Pelagomonas_calceolata.AAC.19
MQRGAKGEEPAGDGGEVRHAGKASKLEASNAALRERKVGLQLLRMGNVLRSPAKRKNVDSVSRQNTAEVESKGQEGVANSRFCMDEWMDGCLKVLANVGLSACTCAEQAGDAANMNTGMAVAMEVHDTTGDAADKDADMDVAMEDKTGDAVDMDADMDVAMEVEEGEAPEPAQVKRYSQAHAQPSVTVLVHVTVQKCTFVEERQAPGLCTC